MAVAKKRNPVMIMLWIILLVVIAVLMVQLFYPMKNDPLTGKVGRIGVGGTSPTANKAPQTTVVTSPPISDSDNVLTEGVIE